MVRKTLKASLAFTLFAFLAACGIQQVAQDKGREAVAFKECMAALPVGPVSTHYNDWAEVVAQCRGYAHWQSMVCYENCPTIPTKTP